MQQENKRFLDVMNNAFGNQERIAACCDKRVPDFFQALAIFALRDPVDGFYGALRVKYQVAYCHEGQRDPAYDVSETLGETEHCGAIFHGIPPGACGRNGRKNAKAYGKDCSCEM